MSSYITIIGLEVHVQLSTADGVLEVRLGPAWFLDQQKLTIEKGDRIDVTGSKVHLASGDSLIAQQVRKGEATLTLRDESGVPAWAGWRRR